MIYQCLNIDPETFGVLVDRCKEDIYVSVTPNFMIGEMRKT